MNRLNTTESRLLQEWLDVARDTTEWLHDAPERGEQEELVFLRQRALDRAAVLVTRGNAGECGENAGEQGEMWGKR